MPADTDLAQSLWPAPPEAGVAPRPRRGTPWALLRGVVDLFYPPVCLACSRATGTTGGLCATCWSGMRFITPPVCERLGTPLPFDLGPGMLSPEAVASPPVFARARAAARYDGAAQTLVHSMKYADRPDYAALLAS